MQCQPTSQGGTTLAWPTYVSKACPLAPDRGDQYSVKMHVMSNETNTTARYSKDLNDLSKATSMPCSMDETIKQKAPPVRLFGSFCRTRLEFNYKYFKRLNQDVRRLYRECSQMVPGTSSPYLALKTG